MKKSLVSFLFFASMFVAYGQQKQDITNTKELFISWRTKADSTIYFGLHSNNTYLIDSLTLNSLGEGIIKLPATLKDGTYFIGHPRKAGFFDFIYENKNIRIILDEKNKPSFPDSKVNRDISTFFDLNFDLNNIGKSYNAKGLSKNEKKIIAEKYDSLLQVKNTFIENYLAQNTNNYFDFTLRLQKDPDLSDLKLEKKEDTLRLLQERVNRYWQHVHFDDERIINNPLIHNKLETYFEKIIPPNVDSIKIRALELIEKAKDNREVQQFFITYIMNKYISHKYVGFDAVFLEVYLKYIANQDNAWFGEQNIKTAERKANQIYFNQIGKPAKDFILLDTSGKSFSALANISSDGLIIAFWDPTCSHCKDEIPQLDTLIRKELKSKMPKLKVLGVMIDGGKSNWIEWIEKKKLSSDLWIHGYDTKAMREKEYKTRTPNYRQLYGIDQTPIFYYIDRKSNIRIKGPIGPKPLINFIKNQIIK